VSEIEWEVWASLYSRWGTDGVHEADNPDCPHCSFTTECYEECGGFMHHVPVFLWPRSEDWGTVSKCDKCGKEIEG